MGKRAAGRSQIEEALVPDMLGHGLHIERITEEEHASGTVVDLSERQTLLAAKPLRDRRNVRRLSLHGAQGSRADG